jgi:hypothetical protein
MDTLTGVLITFCGLLALGGGLKMLRPDPGRTALARLRVRVPRVAVRAIGAAEVALAAATALAGGRLLWATTTAAFVAFTVVGALLWKLGGVASCGCFGATETPPGPVHVAVTTAGALFGAAAIASAPGGPLAAALGEGWAGLAAIASGLLLLGLLYLCLVAVPPLAGAVRTTSTARTLSRSSR